MADNELVKNASSLRRLRSSRWVRELTREVQLSESQMIQPLFVVEGLRAPESVPGLTGVHRETPESLLRQVEADLERGVRKFLLFGVPAEKGERDFRAPFLGSQIRAIKTRFGADLFLATDVCLCSSTVHGHCGVLSESGDHVVNDATVSELSRLAGDFAEAGADCVAPSDMMDGRVAAIRGELARRGFGGALVMSYSAKFNSSFYGPFRVAADSAPKETRLQDRATYQIDPARPSDAHLASLRDAREGADILMVKPAMPYLDVLAALSARIELPWAAYQVSGEYAAIEVLAREGLIARERAHLETWTALRRAGASMIITYGAREARQLLRNSAEGGLL